LLVELESKGVPCGPINELPAVFSEPHVVARGLQVDVARKDKTQIATVAYPAVLSETPATYRRAPPKLGEDRKSVLRDWLSNTVGDAR
jgi:crotonobetainyl-CoA:carnitine CoA-transferase CaiB-like acyl-CoA transferase